MWVWEKQGFEGFSDGSKSPLKWGRRTGAGLHVCGARFAWERG